jgi:hypothetical protein
MDSLRGIEVTAMKEILIRLLVAAFLMLAAFALSSSARGQQSDSLLNIIHIDTTNPAH